MINSSNFIKQEIEQILLYKFFVTNILGICIDTDTACRQWIFNFAKSYEEQVIIEEKKEK